MTASDHLSPGQFYHGTAHEFGPGDVIDPSQPHRTVNMGSGRHVYTTPYVSSAWDYARDAANELNWNGVRGPGISYEGPHQPHVYEVATEDHEDDPHSHGFRTSKPVRVLREIGRETDVG